MHEIRDHLLVEVEALENVFVDEAEALGDVEVDQVFTGRRAEQLEYQEVRFLTIVSGGSIGAIVEK